MALVKGSLKPLRLAATLCIISHNIEAARVSCPYRISHRKRSGALDQFFLLCPRNAADCPAEANGGAKTNFYERDMGVIAHDQVDLARPGRKISGDQDESSA